MPCVVNIYYGDIFLLSLRSPLLQLFEIARSYKIAKKCRAYCQYNSGTQRKFTTVDIQTSKLMGITLGMCGYLEAKNYF